MIRFATIIRRSFTLCIVMALAVPTVANATQGQGNDVKPKRTQMPGEKFRKRNQLSLDAVTALALILRTENKDDHSYRKARKVVSDKVAARFKLDPTALDKNWSRAPRDHQIAALAALTQLNVRYVTGKEDPYVQVDCSGLLWLAWRTAGVDMPRQAVSQLDPRMRVKRSEAQLGDITGEGTHVQIYLGMGLAMIHAPFNGKYVKFKTMSEEQAARVVWTNPSLIATYRL
jgi:cell wall-associated NlpC family hydrolase